MSQLLDDISAPKNHTKAKEFERLFRDYMHYHNHDTIQSRPALEAAPPDIPAASEKVSAPSYSSMVLGFLPMYKAKGRLLLRHLINAGVKWSNKGELISRSGDVIPGSNAVDLVREALVGSRRMKQNYGEPSGWGEFLQTLREALVSPEMKNQRITISWPST